MLSFDPYQFIGAFGTFLVAFFVLRKYLYLPLIEMIDERQMKLAQDLEQAKKARDDMEHMKADNEQHMRAAEKKIQDMMAEATKSAASMREELVGAARHEAKTILEKAQIQLTEEREKVMKGIREEVITLSIQVAERVVQRNMDKDAQKELAKRFVGELEKSPR